jgi:hypothetical protein
MTIQGIWLPSILYIFYDDPQGLKHLGFYKNKYFYNKR